MLAAVFGQSTNFKIMGVMSCSRKSCENIMCDTYVSAVGYVCYECQREFKEYLTKQNIEVKNEGEINRELEKFMATDKDSFMSGKEMSVDDFFSSNRSSR